MNPDKTMKCLCALKAEELWKEFTPQERKMVRFGMFPAAVMTAVIGQGYDSRLLSVALMDCAGRDGGMKA